MKYLMMGAAALALAACSQQQSAEPTTDQPAAPESTVETTVDAMASSPSIDDILASKPDDFKARYQYRHPKETLAFFGVEPGMTVVDILPNEPGWYGEILIPYLGADGKLIGADYSMEMWPLFGNFATAEFLEGRKNWVADYNEGSAALGVENGAETAAFVLGSAPEELAGTVDVVMMVRAAHHFNRLAGGQYFTEALEDIDMVLKPGGIVGVVQHRAPEANDDAWANGDNGYVKQSQIISVFEAAGFEFVEASEINANPKDQPTNDDFVWRLPPTLATSKEDEALKAEMMAIGESDRMTLKFKKPE